MEVGDIECFYDSPKNYHTFDLSVDIVYRRSCVNCSFHLWLCFIAPVQETQEVIVCLVCLQRFIDDELIRRIFDRHFLLTHIAVEIYRFREVTRPDIFLPKYLVNTKCQNYKLE